MSELTPDKQSTKYIKMWMNYFYKEHPEQKPDDSYYMEWIEYVDIQQLAIESLQQENAELKELGRKANDKELRILNVIAELKAELEATKQRESGLFTQLVEMNSELEVVKAKLDEVDASKLYQDNLAYQFANKHRADVIVALQAELASLKAQEPVAWRYFNDKTNSWVICAVQMTDDCEPLYLATPFVKEGFVLVPIEPTEEMLNAWQDESEARFNRTDMGRDGANYRNRFAYQALIKAAPKENQ